MLGTLRICKHCGKEARSENDLVLFKTDNTMKYKKANICKDCSRVFEKIKWTYRNEENRLNTYYKKKYNITYDTVQELKDEQDNVCKICLKPEGVSRLDKFVVDHCHTTNKVRGILCGKCNTALGHLEDDVARLARAIEYLQM